MMPKLDVDAQAFILASGISGINSIAINNLVIDLKSASIWNKMKCIYPFIGSTSTSQKYNLKDSRDLDIAYRLVFSGGGTFSSNGYQSNGVNAFADTFLNPSTSLSLNSTHISVYLRSNVSSGNSIIGVNDGVTGAKGIYILPNAPNLFYGGVNQDTASNISNTDSRGFFLVKRTTSTGIILQKNSTQTSSAVNSSGLTNFKISIGAINSGNTFYYSTNQIAFSSIGDGLTDAEALSFYNIVQNFQTTLSRQV